MRDQSISIDQGQLVIGADGRSGRAWVELGTAGGEADPATLQLSGGELLMTIEALAMAYAELCGAPPASIARGVNRTLRNRTRVARETCRNGADRKGVEGVATGRNVRAINQIATGEQATRDDRSER